MPAINYNSPEYPIMVVWAEESLKPYVLETLIPEYSNAFLTILLELGGAQHTRLLRATNTTPTEAIRPQDIQAFGEMTGQLKDHFGELLWMRKRPAFESERGRVMAIRQFVGANSAHTWVNS